MSTIKTAARIAIREALFSLLDHARLFRNAVKADNHLPAWVMQQNTLKAREEASLVATQLIYSEDQHRQNTQKLPGLIGISHETLTIGQSFNLSKSDFKSAMLNYRKLFGESIRMTDFSSKELRKGLLGDLNIQHLHFVQCYRQIRLFEERLHRVGFSWASATHGSVRLTAYTAIQYLKDKFTPSQAMQDDINGLKQMHNDDIVVIKRPLVPHLRANLSWSHSIEQLRQSSKKSRTQYPGQINTPLPLFIYLLSGQPLPEFNAIKPWSTGTRQERLPRRDACLEKLFNHPNSFLYRPITEKALA